MNPGLTTLYRALLQAEMVPVVLGTAAFFIGLAGEVLLFRDK